MPEQEAKARRPQVVRLHLILGTDQPTDGPTTITIGHGSARAEVSGRDCFEAGGDSFFTVIHSPRLLLAVVGTMCPKKIV